MPTKHVTMNISGLQVPILKSGLKKVLPSIFGAKMEIFFIFSENRKKSKKINLLLKYLKKKSTH